MAYVPGYEWDIFISYASVDNLPIPPDTGWVEVFRRCLEPAVKSRLGSGCDDLRIFFDAKDQTSGRHDKMLVAASRSALFLPIVSRNYFNRQFPVEEMNSFRATCDTDERIFTVQIYRERSEDNYPGWVKSLTHRRFWIEEDDEDMLLTLRMYERQFNKQLFRVAELICEKLKRMRDGRRTANGAGATSVGNGTDSGSKGSLHEEGPQPSGLTILLAQVAGSLDEERESVRDYLVQFGHTVLPQGDYPQGGADFEKAFASDLGRADMFVQLLGRRPTRRPPDLPAGYDRFQHDKALQDKERRGKAKAGDAKRDLEVFCWRHPEQREVDDPAHAELLRSPVIIDGVGLEELKLLVRRAAEKMLYQPPQASRRGADPLVFINADESDEAAAIAYLRECQENGCEAYIRARAGSADEITSFVTERMQDCDALLHIYGNAPQSWVQAQVRFFQKLKAQRSEPPRWHALFIGPPEPKPEPGVAVPGLATIRYTDEGVAELRRLLAELRQ